MLELKLEAADILEKLIPMETWRRHNVRCVEGGVWSSWQC